VPVKGKSRLQFTDAEQDGGRLKEHDRAKEREADRAAMRKDAPPPKDRKKLKRRMTEQKSGAGRKKKGKSADPKTAKTAGQLQFEENKPKPPSKLSHVVKDAPVLALSGRLHHEVSEAEDDNVGVESAHRLEQTAEAGVHLTERSRRAHKLREYRATERAEINALYRQSLQDHPELGSNPLSRWQQKQAIKKQYAAAKRSGQTAEGAARATSTMAERVSDTLKGAADTSKRAGEFVMRHKKGFLIVIGLFLMVTMLLNVMSSCSVLAEAILGSGAGGTYPCEDADMLGAEADYAALEAALQDEVDNYPSYHPGYDEYRYDLDSIGHDPYVLISILTAYHQGTWTRSEVQGTLQMLFDRQYTLTQTVDVEVRYYETDDGDVPYDYYICNVKLENFDLSHLPVYIMGEDQVSVYAMYMSTLGNRPDLFPTSEYPNASQREDYLDYDVPPEALEDEVFAAMLTEAEKYLGMPYVWGGSSPSTSFDCSGFVSWVINHSGWNVGRLGAKSLCNICTPVSPANARPGDLVFFINTYDAPDPNAPTHCGIYVGNNMMIHCGSPISYANLNTNYWQNHFYCYGRLP
jgi:hypothetical protein